jgi:uncharacterized membrane protein
MKASRLHTAFIAGTVAWAVLLLLAPFLASRSHASMLGTGLVVAAYAVGGVVCHQLSERSFHLASAQLPVCARCTGIYLGAAVMALAAWGARGFSTSARETRGRAPVDAPKRREGGQPSVQRRSPKRVALVTLALAVAPTAATLAFEWATGHAPANWIRFSAGIPIGVAVAWLVRSAAENQVN